MGIENYLLPCLNKQLFGLDCPGCGAQRSLILFFKGEFAAAFAMYPAVFTMVLLGFIVALNFFVKFKYAYKIKMALVYINVAIIIISFIIKITT